MNYCRCMQLAEGEKFRVFEQIRELHAATATCTAIITAEPVAIEYSSIYVGFNGIFLRLIIFRSKLSFDRRGV